jgi:hypothetical protein
LSTGKHSFIEKIFTAALLLVLVQVDQWAPKQEALQDLFAQELKEPKQLFDKKQHSQFEAGLEWYQGVQDDESYHVYKSARLSLAEGDRELNQSDVFGSTMAAVIRTVLLQLVFTLC